MTKSRVLPLTLTLGLVLLLGACAAGFNESVDVIRPETDVVAGFWYGLWHGIIAPITFLISLFTEKVNLHEMFNSGGWYDFGFVLGSGIFFGGGFLGVFWKRRKWS